MPPEPFLSPLSLFGRCKKVVDSCKTNKQLDAAIRYCELAYENSRVICKFPNDFFYYLGPLATVMYAKQREFNPLLRDINTNSQFELYFRKYCEEVD